MGQKNKRCFKNELELDLNAYFKYTVGGDDTTDTDEKCRGIGPKDINGKHKSHVKCKEGDKPGLLELDVSNLGDRFKLLIRLKNIPRQRGIAGFKFIPGAFLGTAHHTEYQVRGNKIAILIHIDSRIRPSGLLDKSDIDPKIEHPETSLDFDW